MAGFRVVIPARWGSLRLPGKPLLDLAGRPLLAWVLDVARESGADEVVVATDDERIRKAASRFGADVAMTAADHPSGTDRVLEVAKSRGWADEDIIVNLQGDEPLVPPELVSLVADTLAADDSAGLATVAVPLGSLADALNPNVVKVVTDALGRAMYFSRAPIPFTRDGGAESVTTQRRHDGMLRHIGIYAYRVAALRRIGALPQAPYEEIECLEQLRPLWNGIPIAVAITGVTPPAGVDTAADLERVRALMGVGT
jgi:3-deoxy-manno-octulosonate cytidylyltransferase (CMP-KDO synthetase)